jgi:hypothetical protein
MAVIVDSRPIGFCARLMSLLAPGAPPLLHCDGRHSAANVGVAIGMGKQRSVTDPCSF